MKSLLVEQINLRNQKLFNFENLLISIFLKANHKYAYELVFLEFIE